MSEFEKYEECEVTNPFASPTSKTDVILLVEGHRLYVNKLVLSLASPVFERMFESEFKESRCTEISLPDKKYSDVVEFISCVYPSILKPVTRENLDVVVTLSHEYQVQCLLDRCEAFIVTLISTPYHPTTEELVHFLFLADRYKIGQVLESCIELTKIRSITVGGNPIETIQDYEALSFETKYWLLFKRMADMEKSVEKIDSDVRPEWYSQFVSKYFHDCLSPF